MQKCCIQYASCKNVLQRYNVVILTDEDEEDPHSDLQAEGDADESDEGSVQGEVWPLLQDSLQLGSVGHEQGYVQHALCYTLLIGIVVHVQESRGAATVPDTCMGNLETQTHVNNTIRYLVILLKNMHITHIFT
jgi:hypothetical protein